MSNEIIYTAGDRTPYTYLIGWSKLDKWYYGCRYGINCHPDDFWKTYFTSSNGHKIDGKFKDGSHSVRSLRKDLIGTYIKECIY